MSPVSPPSLPPPLAKVVFCLPFLLCLVSSLPARPDQSLEWPYYAHNPGGTRYSPLAQISPGNVSRLRPAWVFRTGDIAPGKAHYAECTPLVVDGVMYVITPLSRLIAIDALTGVELWRWPTEKDLDASETGGGGLACRGVTYYEEPGAKRIFLPQRNGRLYSIDLHTRLPDPHFGAGGYIDLRAGLGPLGRYLFLSSPPTIYRNILVQPYGVNDLSNALTPYVPLRAFDVRTGEVVWTFHTIPQPGQPGHETWSGDSWKNRGGCNPWSIISLDERNGIFFVPLGAPNPDKYGGDRAGDNLFANCLVALDAQTGERLWHFQTVRHDIWDYDLPAMPNVVDLEIDGQPFPAVAIVGKTGFVYIFHRLTGEPLFPIEDRAVPASDIPPEQAAATQPFPTLPPPFARQKFTAADLHQDDSAIHRELRQVFSQLRSTGIFTPPSKEGTVLLPGQLGGANWSGAAVAPDGMMYVTANELPYIVSLQADDNPFGFKPSARLFLDSRGYPAIAPPWGTLTKISLSTGQILWQKPLGEFPELTARGLPPTGTMNFGGGTITAGGLLFIAASMDAKFRAFSADTGAILFENQMPAAGYGAPVTYLGPDGRQFVAIFAGGGGKAATPPGDYVIAFALDGSPR